MSRFDAGRRNRILVWTGAALAWGTAATMAGLGPVTAKTALPATPDPVVADATGASAMPLAPPGGLVVIRYQPVDQPALDATVDVPDTTPAPGPVAAAQAASVPAPVSSGS